MTFRWNFALGDVGVECIYFAHGKDINWGVRDKRQTATGWIVFKGDILKSQPQIPQNMTVFGKKSHSRSNTLKLGHWSGPLSNMTDVLISRKDLEINMQKGKIMWGGAGSVARWRQRSIGWCIYKTRNANGAPAKQQKLGERPSKGPMAPTLWPQISRLQKWEIMHFCCWGHHVCGMSQQQS